MKFCVQIASDLHSEFFLVEPWKAFIKYLYTPKADALVLAGDLSTTKLLKDSFDELFKYYDKIIYVAGNHEYYGASFSIVHEKLERLCKRYKNRLYWLNDNTVTLNGTRFVGTTLWFRDDPENRKYKHMLSDFTYIQNFEELVYAENVAAIEFLQDTVKEEDVVITHTMPSYKCVPPKYMNSNLNRFFVCDMADLIEKARPKLWIAGHTHTPFDVNIGKTRLLGNPLGYVSLEDQSKFEDKLILDV